MPRRYDDVDDDFPGAPDLRRGVRADAAERVRLPAIFMLVLSGLSVLALLGLLVLLIVMLFVEPPRNQADDIIGVIFLFGGTILLLAMKSFVALGAIAMLRLRMYPVAIIAAVVQIIPISVCSIVDLPIGIWAFVILLMPEVREAFYARQDR